MDLTGTERLLAGSGRGRIAEEKEALAKRLLLDACPAMLAVFDEGFRFVTGTEKLIARCFAGVSAEDLPGTAFADVFGETVEAGWVASTLERCRMALEKLETVRYDDKIPLRDGSRMHVIVTISTMLREGQALGVMFSMYDVTELVMGKEEAETSSLAKSSFLANMSHEIRTPMNAISGMGALLSATPLSETQKAYLQNMLRATDSLLGIMNNILDFTKIDAERMEIVVQEYRLVELISDVADIIDLRSSEKGLSFSVETDPTIPARYLGDELRIKQILVNLLTNAVKYTNEGSVSLTVEMAAGDNLGENFLVFRVEDTGTGIEADRLTGLFGAFAQLDSFGSRSHRGAGLGLAISRGLALSMGGTILAESEYGSGSVFTLRLPQPIVGEEPVAMVENPGEKRVLVVGTGRSDEILTRTLSRLFIQRDFAETAEEFLDHIERHSYTHILFWCESAREIIAANLQRLGSIALIAIREGGDVGAELPPGVAVLYEPVLLPELCRVLSATARTGDLDRIIPLGAIRTDHARALVVDDNEINLVVAEEILRHYEIETTLASSGKDAVEICRQTTFDLIFMDHMMPEMDGIETTERIRALGGKNATVPIIALTANALVGSKDLFLSHRLDDYLAKPIDIGELDLILRRWLPVEKIRDDEAGRPKREEKIPLVDERLRRVARTCPINVQSALKQIGGSEEAYTSVLLAFLSTSTAKADVIRRTVEDKDWGRFQIEIHSQKSALANIGAAALSESARKLELSAAKGRYDYILTRCGTYLESMEKLREGLRQVFPARKEENRPAASERARESLAAEARRTIDLLDALENTEAMESVAALRSHSYGEKNDKLLTEAQSAIYRFEYDKATTCLRQIR